jgi:nucleotide-binding universal stress UspA family protein
LFARLTSGVGLRGPGLPAAARRPGSGWTGSGTEEDIVTDIRTPDAEISPGGIVVGVDGSPTSELALRWAVEQARRTGQTVAAVVAWDFPTNYGVDYLDDRVDWAEDARTALKAAVEHVVAGAGSPRVEQHVRQGHAARVLLDAADGADLLVVGSRGHGGFTGLLLGSVSQHLAAHAPCPVLVVPPPERRAS